MKELAESGHYMGAVAEIQQVVGTVSAPITSGSPLSSLLVLCHITDYHVGGCQNYGPFFGIPVRIRHIGYPNRDHNFDNHP